MTDTKAKPLATIQALGLTMDVTFVPWSLSSNAGEDMPSLNWKVSINHEGRPILTTNYMQGMGHAHGYKQNDKSIHHMQQMKNECEGKGQSHRHHPSIVDVLYSLVSDAQAINYPTYEQYADDMDMDPDSRSGEATYRLCVQYGLTLRAALGEKGLEELNAAFQDY